MSSPAGEGNYELAESATPVALLAGVALVLVNKRMYRAILLVSLITYLVYLYVEKKEMEETLFPGGRRNESVSSGKVEILEKMARDLKQFIRRERHPPSSSPTSSKRGKGPPILLPSSLTEQLNKDRMDANRMSIQPPSFSRTSVAASQLGEVGEEMRQTMFLKRS